MKKNFEQPIIEVYGFLLENVLTLSGEGQPEPALFQWTRADETGIMEEGMSDIF